MGVRQIITAECDAVNCAYNEEAGGRVIEPQDRIVANEDFIFHGRCFDEMTPMDVAIAFRLNVRQGDFRPADAPVGPDGIPSVATFIAPATHSATSHSRIN